MARVKDLWFSSVPDPSDPRKKIKRKTLRHPDRGGSKNARRWLACWIGPDGAEKTKAFRLQDAAKKYAQKQAEDVERDEYVDPKDAAERLDPLGRKWLKLKRPLVGAATFVKYERALRLHIGPTFGQRKIGSIKPSEVQQWLNDLAEKVGPSTQEIALLVLSGIFDLAAADGARRDNPAKSPIIVPPVVEAPEREVWTADRAYAVIEAHPVRYKVLPTLMAGCGMREGEAFAAAEEDFDFDGGTVRVSRQVAYVAGVGWAFKAPKRGKARTAHLPAGVARSVKAHIEAFPPRPYALPWVDEHGKPSGEVHVCKLLVRWESKDPRTSDQHVRASSYDKAVWKHALGAAGVIPVVLGPRGGTYGLWEQDRLDSTHALRHFCSSTLQDAQVALGGVMDMLGHSKKAMPTTVRVYGNPTAETYEQARSAIDRTLFRLRPVKDQVSIGTETEQAG